MKNLGINNIQQQINLLIGLKAEISAMTENIGSYDRK